MSMLHSVGILARVTSVSYRALGETREEGLPPKHCRRLQLPVLSMSHLQSLSIQVLWTLRAGLMPSDTGTNLAAYPLWVHPCSGNRNRHLKKTVWLIGGFNDLPENQSKLPWKVFASLH